LPFLETVELIVAYHAAVLGGILILAKGPRSLSLFCFVFAAHMLTNIGAELNLIPPGANITSAYGLAYGPLMYLFVRELCLDDAKVSAWPDTIHFLPPILVALVRPQDPIPQIIGFPLIVAYCVFIFLRLRDHAQIAPQVRSDDNAISLNWIKTAFFAFVAIALFDFARSAAPASWPINDNHALAVTLFFVVILLSVMAWKSLIHRQLMGAISASDRATAGISDAQPDLNAAADAFAKIDAVVRERALWREPRLTLDNVAEATAHTPREVSRAINLVRKVSFSNYINELRVDHVDALMDDAVSRDRTLLDLSFEAGFNSKSAFNRHYRMLRGEPPSKALARKRAADGPKNID